MIEILDNSFCCKRPLIVSVEFISRQFKLILAKYPSSQTSLILGGLLVLSRTLHVCVRCDAMCCNIHLQSWCERLCCQCGTLPDHACFVQYPCTGFYISPHSAIATGSFGLLPGFVATFSIFLTTNSPSPNTRPNTTCLLSSQSVFAQVMKN